MPITTIPANMTTLLRENGYINYCFVSYAYPHEDENPDDHPMTKCARQMQRKIQQELRNLVNDPKVFLFNNCMPVGRPLSEEIKKNLAGSLTMVAVLSGPYFTEEHRWCGIEWEAMDQLWEARFANDSEQNDKVDPIMPILFRKQVALPPRVAARVYIDISPIAIIGNRYYESKEFRQTIIKIINRIVEVAELVRTKGYKARVDNFRWPLSTPFADWPPPTQPAPMRMSLTTGNGVKNENGSNDENRKKNEGNGASKGIAAGGEKDGKSG